MKKYLFIVLFAFVLFTCPTVFASNSWNGTASVGRSAVLDTSNNYYYTDWKLLSSNSLNILPIPYSGGQYYHMGAEYSFPFTAMGDTTYVAQFRVPVVSNTIYNYTLMNGLNSSDVKVGIDKDFSVYNVNWTVDSIQWECSTYSNYGVAHNYCYYDVKVHFTITDPIYGAYNLNFAVLNSTASRSSYYYDGYDSQGCAIEFPNAASGSGYPLMSPSVILNGYSSGGGGNTDTDEITDSIDSASQDIQDAIQESYENLVKSQEICTVYDKNAIFTDNYLILSNGTLQSNNSFGITDYISISSSDSLTKLTDSLSLSRFCFYNANKSLLSCSTSNDLSDGTLISIPNTASYVRFTIEKALNKPQYRLCRNGNQAIYDFLNEPFDGSGIGADISDVEWYENSYFSSLITSPIAFLSSLSDSCTPITLTLFGQNVVLPCGDTVFWGRQSTYIQNFRTFWNLLFAGYFIYKLALKLILTVNDCLDPQKDNVGGLDI